MTLGEIVEAIAKRLPVGRGAEAEARQVRRYNVIAVGDERDEIAEHVRRGGESMQQQQSWMLRIAGLTVEDRHRADFDIAIGHLGGGLGGSLQVSL